MRISFGDSGSWPVRKVINMAATDDGTLNWQMDCAHVVWARVLLPCPGDEFQTAMDTFERGEHVEAYCPLCKNGVPASYPLGVTLPIVRPF